jgi:glycine/sarcosine N-methyltransferase
VEFYERLAAHYDDLFEEEPQILAYLTRSLPPAARVLDLACGTGTYAAALCRDGHHVTGIDLSEPMISLARIKAPSARLIAGDMRQASRLAPGPFDLIFCIGNSLAHLASRDEAHRLISDAAGELAGDGSLILQTVNFDRPLRRLPSLEASDVRMERRFAPHPQGTGRVLFTAVVESEGGRWEQTTPLLALSSDELEAMVSDAGLAVVELHGAYDGRLHAPESMLTIIRATR